MSPRLFISRPVLSLWAARRDRVRILTLMLPADGNYTIVPQAAGPFAACALSLIEMAAQPITPGEEQFESLKHCQVKTNAVSYTTPISWCNAACKDAVQS